MADKLKIGAATIMVVAAITGMTVDSIHSDNKKTEQMKVCLENGGQWVQKGINESNRICIK